MKLFAVALCLGLSSLCFGAVPDKLEGFVYYETEQSSPAHITKTSALSLGSGGRFTGLFQISTGTGVSGGFNLSSREDGSYTYAKRDQNTAELTLSFPLGGGGTGKRTLRFTSDSAGNIAFEDLPPGSLSTVSFRVASLSSPAPLSNCSNRSFVRAGGMATTGFVINSGGSGYVLVRAVGPTLSAFGVAAPLRDPRLTLVNATGNTLAANDDWNIESAIALSRTGAALGAFALPENSKDAAVLRALAPGAYTVQISSPVAADTGEALIEVYLLP